MGRLMKINERMKYCALCERLSDLCGKKKRLTTENTKKPQRNAEKKK